MCYAVTCRTCGKTTWSGCGQHVDQVMGGVPAAQRCAGHQKEAGHQKDSSGGMFAKLFGR